MAHDGKLILVTGGSRSGKSRFAQGLCERLEGRRVYLATCPHIAGDHEMENRIQRHRDERTGRGWQTMEEPVDPAAILAMTEAEVILLDCVTLWVNNLLYAAEQKQETMAEDRIGDSARRLGQAARDSGKTVVMVTSEIGLGIIPADPATRHYRDCIGRANQILGDLADEVFLVCCGQPLRLK